MLQFSFLIASWNEFVGLLITLYSLGKKKTAYSWIDWKWFFCSAQKKSAKFSNQEVNWLITVIILESTSVSVAQINHSRWKFISLLIFAAWLYNRYCTRKNWTSTQSYNKVLFLRLCIFYLKWNFNCLLKHCRHHFNVGFPQWFLDPLEGTWIQRFISTFNRPCHPCGKRYLNDNDNIKWYLVGKKLVIKIMECEN